MQTIVMLNSIYDNICWFTAYIFAVRDPNGLFPAIASARLGALNSSATRMSQFIGITKHRKVRKNNLYHLLLKQVYRIKCTFYVLKMCKSIILVATYATMGNTSMRVI